MYRLLADSITEADIDPARTTRSDTGDGFWLLVAAEVSTARLLHPLATCLVNGAAEENERVAEVERLRLRVVVHSGDVIPDPQGQAGACLIHAARLLDADATRAVLVNSPEATGVVVTSEMVYDAIVRHGYPGIDPDDWRSILIRAKETSARAWVHFPGLARQPCMPSVLENPPPGARHSWWRARRRQDEPAELSRSAAGAAKRGRRRAPQREHAGLSGARRLPQSPAAVVPNPGPLPGGSRMPLARNPLFVGHLDDLRRMAAVLEKGRDGAPCPGVAITGIGGAGKTQLAAEFVHRYGPCFAGGVFWLSFADPSAIEPQVAACGCPGFMRLRADFREHRLEDQLAMVRGAWQTGIPRLLVFDGCETEELLVKWRPPTGGCRVIVTTQRSRWDPALGVEPLPVDVLDRTQSLLLLARFRPDLDPADRCLDAIANELGDLPLGLHLAGSYLRRYQAVTTPERYLAELRELGPLEHDSLRGRGLSRDASPTGHVQDVAQTFSLSCGRLTGDSEVDRMARKLLAHAGGTTPGEPFPREQLVRTLDETSREEQTLREDALLRLQDLGLLEAMDGRFRLHRLLAHFVRGPAFDPAQVALLAACSERRGRADSGACGRRPT